MADQLAGVEQRLTAVERGSQLAHSSIEAGQLAVFDPDGNPVLLIGDQGDGTYTVAGVNGGIVVAQDLDLPAGTITETDISDDAISTPKLTANAVTADKIEAGTITARELAAAAITAEAIEANAVTADKIATNAVTAGKIAAGAITTEKLTVGGQQALATRVYDACGDLADWQANQILGSLTVQPVVDSVSGGTVIRAVGAVNGLVRMPLIPFDPTALYRVKVRVRQTVAPTGDTTASRVYAGFAAVSADGATYINISGAITGTDPASGHYIAAQGATLVAGGGWQEYTGYLRGTGATGTGTPRADPNNPGVAVNGTRYLRPLLYLNFPNGNGTAEVDLVAVDIVPAGSVAAVSIADGAITADKLSANAITGKVITGGTFYTRSSAPRVEMGETAYEGGAVASIKWDLLGRGWDEPVIQAAGITGGKRRFQIRGPAGTSGAAGTSLIAEDTDYSWKAVCWTDPVTAISTFKFTPAGGLEISTPRSAAAKQITLNEGYVIYADNAGAGSAGNRVWLDGPNGGEAIIGPRAGSSTFGSIRLRTNATTATAANAVIDSATYQLYRSTSSLQYKTDVEDLGLDLEALRRLRPRRFRDKSEVDEQGDSARFYCGFVAEEVHDLGLAELVTYDADGEPDALQYDRFCAALLLLVQDQDRRLAELAARVAELEGR
ncbi:tail fiber domain-containing protein [Micromonospora sp. NPDC006766]|uniref:tail fiber domain-containing protein n=1 Tax=Micromonospora sp. NPDC006766 TaxID=3154778 RepID=UPI003408D95A